MAVMLETNPGSWENDRTASTPSQRPSSVRLRVTYQNPADLVTDSDQQFAKGGFLVRIAPPDSLRLYSSIELGIDLGNTFVTLQTQVVLLQPFGIAVSFDPSNPDLVSLVERARASGINRGPEPQHYVLLGTPRRFATGTTPPPATSQRLSVPPITQRPSTPAPIPERASTPTINELIAPQYEFAADTEPCTTIPIAEIDHGNLTRAQNVHLAMHGSKKQRLAILRGSDRSLHRFVLRNPGLQGDEVTYIARLATTGPDVLKAIADRRDWSGRPETSMALIRNPKTPIPIAVRLVSGLGVADLQQIARGIGVRPPIVRAAKFRLNKR